MKKIFSVLFAILLLCMSVMPSYAANPVISVNTVSSASVGDTITVSVNLSANSGLAGVQFTINFNTSEFQLVSDSVKETNLFFATTKSGSGIIKYAGTSIDAINTSGTLVTFNLKVLKTDGKISLSVNDAIDENDRFVSVSAYGKTVGCSHANMEWTVTQKATCTTNGTKKGVCNCGYTTTATLQKTGHTYGEWIVQKPATTTQTGIKYSKCSTCGDRREQVIPAIVVTTTKPSVETTTRPSAETTTRPSTVATTKPSAVTTTKPSAETTTRPSTVTTTKPSAETTTRPSVVTTTKPSTVTTTTSNEAITTEKIEESTTILEEITNIVETTTNLTTEEQTTEAEIVEKTSTSKIVATTIIVVLGIEAIAGLIIFFVIKNKKKK